MDEVTAKQIGKYGKEPWEKKPAMVWAKPGVSDDAMKAGCWLDETGKPYTKGPWTESPPNAKGGNSGGFFDGDVLLPAADQSYDAIQPGNRDHLAPYAIRHLTVEGNAAYQVRYTVLGNLWIKDNGDLGKGTLQRRDCRRAPAAGGVEKRVLRRPQPGQAGRAL